MIFLNFLKKRLKRLTRQTAALREQRRHENALINEIDRILSETKTKIPLVPHYRRQLKEPVRLALKTIDEMTAQIPGPEQLDPVLWGKSPVLQAVFTGPDAFSRWMDSCIALQNAFKQNHSDELFGLLVAQYKEKTSLGVAIVGEIVQKDVLQQSVYFENPRIVVPRPDLETAKKELRHRIIVMLFTRELDEIADLKSLTEELKRQQDILEIKLSMGKKQGAVKKTDDKTLREARQIIDAIDREIEGLGRNPDTPESHLEHVTEVLMNIKRHLEIKPFILRLNSLGVRVTASSPEPFDEISFAECTFTGDHKRAVIWVQINRSSLNKK